MWDERRGHQSKKQQKHVFVWTLGKQCVIVKENPHHATTTQLETTARNTQPLTPHHFTYKQVNHTDTHIDSTHMQNKRFCLYLHRTIYTLTPYYSMTFHFVAAKTLLESTWLIRQHASGSNYFDIDLESNSYCCGKQISKPRKENNTRCSAERGDGQGQRVTTKVMQRKAWDVLINPAHQTKPLVSSVSSRAVRLY